jgi:hypothetical protein
VYVEFKVCEVVETRSIRVLFCAGKLFMALLTRKMRQPESGRDSSAVRQVDSEISEADR